MLLRTLAGAADAIESIEAARVHHAETVIRQFRLWRREFANQRPPDFLFVFNERLGLLWSVVPYLLA
jgi:hypothetical protein